MDLILWRHAEAEDGEDDLARALTGKGEVQAARMAAWLHRHVPKPWTVVASPARRTQQTAAALGVPFITSIACQPGASARAVLDAAGWPEGQGTRIVVGHQPSLGLASALALTGVAAPWALRKGAVVWLRARDRAEVAPVQLRASLSPDLVGD